MNSPRPIDPRAIRIPQNSGLPPCLYIPVAARDREAIERYVGTIRAPSKGDALIVDAHESLTPDIRLPIWKMPESRILHYPLQIWVHVDYTAYRRAYIQAFPELSFSDQVLDHVVNRRIARLKGFMFLRIVPISRMANSSHGSLSERWGVEHHSSSQMRQINETSLAQVQYADLCDLVKMLNMPGGGSVMDNVNEAQKLVRPSTEP